MQSSSFKHNLNKMFQIKTSGNQFNEIEEVGREQFESGRGIYRSAQVSSNPQ